MPLSFPLLQSLDDPGEKSFVNIVGNGKNAGNQYLLPRCILPYQRQKSSFEVPLLSANTSV